MPSRSFGDCSGTRAVAALRELLEAEGEKKGCPAYGAFAGETLCRGTVSLTGYLLTLALEDENVYMLARRKEGAIDPLLEEAVREELKVIEAAGKLDCETVRAGMDDARLPPRWKTGIYS